MVFGLLLITLSRLKADGDWQSFVLNCPILLGWWTHPCELVACLVNEDTLDLINSIYCRRDAVDKKCVGNTDDGNAIATITKLDDFVLHLSSVLEL
ncbi:hypothetical protein T4A_10682 [Trichinella pseudospiralis]|uniref:Uncharacterized protein n=1 Tax=Trichinella pseudospiralis TaxID=6337 RepID=A0A0V1DSB9_TRIPS|nr:hypothetical protein T4A_10682 [Trichinella pseudospiralis]